MARSMILMLGGKDYELVANWKASQSITDEMMDIMVIADDAVKAAHFREHNIPYEPKFEFTFGTTAKILYLAMRSCGYELTYEEVGEFVVADGGLKHVENASKYLALYIKAGPKELEGGKAKSGKS